MAGKGNRQARRDEKQWSEILLRFDSSGLSPRKFCDVEEVSLSSFQRWRRRLGPISGSAEFVELEPTPSPTPGPSRDVATSWTLEVSLPNGLCLRFRG